MIYRVHTPSKTPRHHTGAIYRLRLGDRYELFAVGWDSPEPDGKLTHLRSGKSIVKFRIPKDPAVAQAVIDGVIERLGVARVLSVLDAEATLNDLQEIAHGPFES
jgi:hypothetical protein